MSSCLYYLWSITAPDLLKLDYFRDLLWMMGNCLIFWTRSMSDCPRLYNFINVCRIIRKYMALVNFINLEFKLLNDEWQTYALRNLKTKELSSNSSFAWSFKCFHYFDVWFFKSAHSFSQNLNGLQSLLRSTMLFSTTIDCCT